MKKPFQNDSPIGQWLHRLGELVLLNLAWVVCCLPIITVGAASCGLHFALSPQRKEEDRAIRCFFHSFRRNFKQATLLWLILLALGLCLMMCLRIVSFWEGGIRTAGIVFFCFPAMFLLMIAGYGFPLLAQFEVPTRKLVPDTLLLGLAHFPRTLLVIGLNLLPAMVIYFLPSALVCVVFVWIPIGFSVTAKLIEVCLEPVFAPFRPAE